MPSNVQVRDDEQRQREGTSARENGAKVHVKVSYCTTASPRSSAIRSKGTDSAGSGGRWSRGGGKGSPEGLDDEQCQGEHDEKDEEQDALTSRCSCLVSVKVLGVSESSFWARPRREHLPCSLSKLHDALLHVSSHVVNVVIDTIQQCSLINDKCREILKQLGKFGNATSDLVHLSIPRCNVGLCRVQLRRRFFL